MSSEDQSKVALGPDNPWPGLNQFFEDHEQYFRGRDEEKAELFRLVKSETLTILFGKSGLGKSSLLQAGLFPLLRQAGYLPVFIHIRYDDAAIVDSESDPPLASEVYAALREACDASKVEAPEMQEQETLWEYFHQAGASFWNERNRLVTPVLVFDQFEEAFTLGGENGRRRKRRDAFLAQLEELVENRPPQGLRERWDKDPDLVTHFEQDCTPCKIILSLREDFLPDLEQLKQRIRSIMRNRFRLERMDGGKAWQVVTGERIVDGEPRRALSHLVDEDVGLQIIDFVSKTRGQRDQSAFTRDTLRARTVDPALLSVVCSELNNRRRAKKPPQEKISFTLLSDNKDEIIREFFDSHVNALGAGAGPVRRFIEEDLITGSGFRKRCDLDDALRQQGVTRDALNRLEQHRILRFEPNEGITWIELTHDLLTEVVSTSRRQRREREEREKTDSIAAERKKRQRKKNILIYSSLTLFALAALSTFLLFQERHRREEASRVATEMRRLATKMHLGRAERMLEVGDQSGAFLLFDRALKTDPDTENDLKHRLRLGAAWRQLPQLRELLYFDKLSRAELAPGGGFIAASGPSGVRLWRLDPEKQMQSAEPKDLITDRKVTWASFHPDPHKLLLVTAAIAPDGATQVRSSPRAKGEATVWNAETGQPEGTYPTAGTTKKVWFDPDGSDRVLVVSDSDDDTKGRVAIWNYRTGTEEARLSTELPVNWAAFSKDGRFVVIAEGESQEGTKGRALVWQWQKPFSVDPEHVSENPIELRHEGGPVVYAEFNEDGTKVLTAEGVRESPAGAACLWSYPITASNTGNAWQRGVLSAIFAHDGPVTRAHFSPDGRWIATASRDSTVRLWHVKTQKEVLKLKHDGDVNDVEFSPDGRYLVSGGRDRKARVWEVATGQLIESPFWHSETIVEAAFSRDGRRILTSSKHFARIWAVGLDEPRVSQLKVNASAFNTVSADGKRLLTISERDQRDRRLMELWQIASGRRLAAMPLEHAGQVPCAAIDTEGSSVAVVSRDPDSRTFILQTYKLDHPLDESWAEGRFEAMGSPKSHSGEAVFVTFSSRDRRLCTISRPAAGEPAQEILLWDIAAAQPLDASPGKQDLPMRKAQFSPQGTFLLATGIDPVSKRGEGRVWDLRATASERKPAILNHDEPITTAAFSCDERRVLTGSEDDNAKLWELNASKITGIHNLRANEGSDNTHKADLTSTQFSPDGKSALTTSKDQTAILWNLEKSDPVARTLPHPAVVNDGVFSADGSLVLTVSAELKLRVWDVKSGDLLAVFNFEGDWLKAGFVERERPATGSLPEGVFVISQNHDKRGALVAAEENKEFAPLDPSSREEMPMAPDISLFSWSLAPLDLEPQRRSNFGKLLSARFMPEKERKIDTVATTELRDLWKEKGKDYAAMCGPDQDSEQYHQAAAERCEATRQWFAAAWHLSQLNGLRSGPADVDLLLRRARNYARAECWARSIADYKAVSVRRADRALYCEIARTSVEYAQASDPAQWDVAMEAYNHAANLDPRDVLTRVNLGEVFAAKRDFLQARAQFRDALNVGEAGPAISQLLVAGRLGVTNEERTQFYAISSSTRECSPAANQFVWPSVLTPEFSSRPKLKEYGPAIWRLAVAGWLSGTDEGRAEYRAICKRAESAETSPAVANLLVWPSVLTPEFEGDTAFCNRLVELAQASVDANRSDFDNLSILGAALYRAKRYHSALLKLEEARAVFIAERAATLRSSYDHLIRTPISLAVEGRPLDWVFIAMAHAQLGHAEEAENWMKKVRDSPELSYRPLKKRPPASWDTLCLELLYNEAEALLATDSTTPGFSSRSAISAGTSGSEANNTSFSRLP